MLSDGVVQICLDLSRMPRLENINEINGFLGGLGGPGTATNSLYAGIAWGLPGGGGEGSTLASHVRKLPRPPRPPRHKLKKSSNKRELEGSRRAEILSGGLDHIGQKAVSGKKPLKRPLPLGDVS